MDRRQGVTAAAPAAPLRIKAHAAATPAAGLYSIRGHFDSGCAVLLTGASGYIGSLVLEKLLRSTDVGRVYVLLRPRRGLSPAQRVEKLLKGPLFHLLDESSAARVTAVAGDILEPGLGLSEADEALLRAEVDTVIHSAADIRLDAPILDTLRANYRGSCAVASLAARMERLRSLVYVSTCYVNINKPQGSRVEERVYPLMVGGEDIDAVGVAEELLALPEPEAEALAAKYIDLWGFKNTYAMGKHLAEKAVARIAAARALPFAIVRPSLVSGVAAEPYPGYSGNFAGQVGGAVAYLVGLYNDQPQAVASDGASVWDVVPGDYVAHGIIATAAAAASPAAREHIAPPADAGAKGTAGGEGAGRGLMIVHVNSASNYPLSMANMFNDGVIWCTAYKRPFTLALGRARGMDPCQAFDEAKWAKHMRSAARKVGALAWFLRLLGGKKRERLARTLDAGLKTYETINVIKYDLQLFFQAATLGRLEECLEPAERDEFRFVWRAAGPKPGQAPAALVTASVPSGSGSGGSSPTPSLDGDRAAAAAAAAPAAGGPAAPFAGRYAGAAEKAAVAAAFAGGSESDGDARAAAAEQVAAVVRYYSNGGDWHLFHYNVLAYLWKTIYGRVPPPEASAGVAAVRKLLPHLPAEEAAAAARVWHTFTAFA